MTAVSWVSLIGAGVALAGLALHVVTYAFREGRKDQRLNEVEAKVSKIETTDGGLALVSLEIKHIGERFARYEAESTKKFDELQDTIKALMLRPAPRRRPGED